jgi:hypothetical protein
MARHDKLVEMMISGKMPMPNYYTKNDEELYRYAQEFEQVALQYIRAVEQGRVICFIQGVSQSGMTRRMTFKMCRQNTGYVTYQYHDLNQFISSAAGIRVNGAGELIVEGCGMDMVFWVHNEVIRCLRRLGFLKKKRAEKLAQMVPETVY